MRGDKWAGTVMLPLIGGKDILPSARFNPHAIPPKAHFNRFQQRNFMKPLTILFVTLFLSNCVSIKSGGGFEFSGRVVDEKTKEPIQGASVRLNYTAVGFFADNSKKSATLTTDANGQFYELTAKVTLSGVLGSVDKWPDVEYSKNGYYRTIRPVNDPSRESYKDLLLTLGRK